MHNDQSAQDARTLLVALSSNHPEARRASPFVGMDRPFSPSWADAEQAGLDRVRRNAATRWLVDKGMLERAEEAENQRGEGKEPVEHHTLGETFVAVCAEYDAGGNIIRRLGSLVNRGPLLQGSHEPGAHDRVGALNPDQAQGLGRARSLSPRLQVPSSGRGARCRVDLRSLCPQLSPTFLCSHHVPSPSLSRGGGRKVKRPPPQGQYSNTSIEAKTQHVCRPGGHFSGELLRSPSRRTSEKTPSTRLGECLGGPKQGYLSSMAQEADYYTAHEAARLLGISPARVRQMLRAGELEGERGPELPEGVPGPWRVPAGAVSAYGEAREVLEAADADETVALPHQEEIASPTPRDAPGIALPEGRPPEEAPSETSERLSEGMGRCGTRSGRSSMSWICWRVAWRPRRSNTSACLRPRAERKSEPKSCRRRWRRRGPRGGSSSLGPGGEDCL